MNKALVVLSGGQDSTTCLYWAKQKFDEVHAITFDYGQRHRREIEAATTIAAFAGVGHEIIELGDGILAGRSPLTNPMEELEQYKNHTEMAEIIGDRVEKTFVPMRNALFLTIAANRAICRDILNIVTGVCQADNANYPDCRMDFIRAQRQAINMALGLDTFDTEVKIDTPLMDMSKAESIKLALTLPGCFAALAFSHTAYDGQFPPLGNDHATILRAQGFLEAGLPDPLIVRANYMGQMDLPETDNYFRWLKAINQASAQWDPAFPMVAMAALEDRIGNPDGVAPF